jgi:hypothetical protein
MGKLGQTRAHGFCARASLVALSYLPRNDEIRMTKLEGMTKLRMRDDPRRTHGAASYSLEHRPRIRLSSRTAETVRDLASERWLCKLPCISAILGGVPRACPRDDGRVV